MKGIIANIGHTAIEKELLELWYDYEEGSSLEGDLAKQLDKFEMILQADEYERAHQGKLLQSFFDSTRESFTHPEVSLIV